MTTATAHEFNNFLKVSINVLALHGEWYCVVKPDAIHAALVIKPFVNCMCNAMHASTVRNIVN